MLSIYLLIPLSLMLFVVAIWAVRYAVTSNQFEDLDNASQRIILDDRQERRQVLNQPTANTNNTDNTDNTDNTHDTQYVNDAQTRRGNANNSVNDSDILNQ